jgi:hypothetical protein
MPGVPLILRKKTACEVNVRRSFLIFPLIIPVIQFIFCRSRFAENCIGTMCGALPAKIKARIRARNARLLKVDQESLIYGFRVTAAASIRPAALRICSAVYVRA